MTLSLALAFAVSSCAAFKPAPRVDAAAECVRTMRAACGDTESTARAERWEARRCVDEMLELCKSF